MKSLTPAWTGDLDRAAHLAQLGGVDVDHDLLRRPGEVLRRVPGDDEIEAGPEREQQSSSAAVKLAPRGASGPGRRS
jgi:hypothetical protein